MGCYVLESRQDILFECAPNSVVNDAHCKCGRTNVCEMDEICIPKYNSCVTTLNQCPDSSIKTNEICTCGATSICDVDDICFASKDACVSEYTNIAYHQPAIYSKKIGDTTIRWRGAVDGIRETNLGCNENAFCNEAALGAFYELKLLDSFWIDKIIIFNTKFY